MHSINLLVQDRRLIREAVAGLPDEAWFVIPRGFDNNIAWNVGHILVTQQALHYRLSGLPTATTKADSAMFKSGTSPAGWSQEPEPDRLLALLDETAVRLEQDFEAGVFTRFLPYTTGTGIQLQCLEDALAFNNFHEGLHLGSILALRNFLDDA